MREKQILARTVWSPVKSAENDRKAQPSATKAAQRWAVSSIGRESIKYSWIEWVHKTIGEMNLTNLRMYGSITLVHRNVHATCVVSVRMSKISCYENPYTVTGGIKLIGSKESPKSICKDKGNGTLETVNMEKISSEKCLSRKICVGLA